MMIYVKASAECLSDAMMKAQNAILERQRNDRSAADMKTTCTVLMIGEDGIFRGHVGDSRIYYFRNGKMEDPFFKDHEKQALDRYADLFSMPRDEKEMYWNEYKSAGKPEEQS